MTGDRRHHVKRTITTAGFEASCWPCGWRIVREHRDERDDDAWLHVNAARAHDPADAEGRSSTQTDLAREKGR